MLIFPHDKGILSLATSRAINVKLKLIYSREKLDDTMDFLRAVNFAIMDDRFDVRREKGLFNIGSRHI